MINVGRCTSVRPANPRKHKTVIPNPLQRVRDLLFTPERHKPLAKKIVNRAGRSSGHGFSRAVNSKKKASGFSR
jgi:hypothetical protein